MKCKVKFRGKKLNTAGCDQIMELIIQLDQETITLEAILLALWEERYEVRNILYANRY